jgi:copper chaperone
LTLQSGGEFKIVLAIKKVINMTLQLKVSNMACAACGETITEAIKAVDPNAEVQTDPKTKLVSVQTQAPEVAIKQAITTAGYSVA